jgi:hypothetical protein
MTVIGDLKQAKTAVLDQQLNRRCAGIERVLRQFLDGVRGTLNHLRVQMTTLKRDALLPRQFGSQRLREGAECDATFVFFKHDFRVG